MNTPLLVDSHCHLNGLDLSAFDNNLQCVLDEARLVGVSHILSVCIDLPDIPALQEIAEHHSNISFSVGVHPTYQTDVDADMLVRFADHPKCIAIGETGLDYYHVENEHDRMTQRERFRAHIHASITSHKPLIIHTRQASEDTLRLLQDENAASIGGVMHCFTEDWSVAKRALDLNFYISFSGILTFKNATQLHDVAKRVPLDRILIETDSPYLAPVPFRGKQNHPALVKYVALQLAEFRQLDYETIAQSTTENFYRCFHVSSK